GGQREAEVRVGELRAQALECDLHDLAVVERGGREASGRLPRGVRRHLGIDVARNEAEVGSRKLPALRVPARLAASFQLLEMGELVDVDLGRKVAANRLLERLARLEITARKCPAALERIFGALHSR